MAKDGTNRGGARIGAGAKKKPLADKIAEGNPGKRTLTVIDFDNKAVDLEGQQMPKPSKLLSATQKDGKPLVAEEVYIATWEWLAERKCATLVSPQLLERYAMSVARWIQCEEAISDFSFLAKHPTTGNAIQSPYIAMSQNFMSQTNRLWMEIYQIVKENCATEYSGATPMDDAMERLLEQNTEQRETLTRLMAQGYIDQVLSNSETNALLTQANTYREDIKVINATMSGDSSRFFEAERLLHFAERGSMLEEYSEDLFERLVDHIQVYSRHEVGFVMKCGLTFKEMI